jgi:hypothetical protein
MAMKNRWVKRTFLIFVGLLLCVAIGFAALRSWSRSFEKGKETKWVRELSGIVKGKGYRKFEKENASRVENGQYFYADEDGRLVQRYPGNEDWLIYYEVEYFDPRDEPMSSRLLENEKKRVSSGKVRTAIVAKEKYDQMIVGERIFASYQRFSESDVMIWGCEKKSSLPGNH